MKKRMFYFGVFFAALLIGGVPALLLLKPVKTQVMNSTKQEISAVPASTPSEVEVLEENNASETEEEAKFKIRLIEVGEGYHGDQIEAKNGETWLSLSRENENYFLRQEKVTVRRAYDPVVDDEETNQKTGKSVSISGRAASVFLLKNAPQLKEGEVNTLYAHIDSDEEESLFNLKTGFTRTFTLGKEAYTLSVKRGRNKANEDIIALILENGTNKQVLHSYRSFENDDNIGSLIWAGDIDRDGKPDFYLNVYVHENATYKNLFLSAPAEKGKLVKKIAVFTTTGC